MSEQKGAWIRTVPIEEADDTLLSALAGQGELYPAEYRVRIPSLAAADEKSGGGIVMSHSLIPGALYHAFATFGSLMSPDLPLSRNQHEMIAATVSALNRCFY